MARSLSDAELHWEGREGAGAGDAIVVESGGWRTKPGGKSGPCVDGGGGGGGDGLGGRGLTLGLL